MNLTKSKTEEIIRHLKWLLDSDGITDADITDAIYDAYQLLIFANGEADIYDLVIEYKNTEGKTIRHSWLEREDRLDKRHAA